MKKFKLINSIIITTLCIGAISIISKQDSNIGSLVVVHAINACSAIESIQLSDLFNCNEYLELYPELNVLINNNSKEETLFNHFITVGMLEGKQPSKSFNIYAYKSAYSDLQLAFGNDIQKYYMHYINNGYYEGRDITTIEKANSLGIVVTDFNNKVITSKGNSVVNSSAKVENVFSIKLKPIENNTKIKYKRECVNTLLGSY